MYRLRWNCGHGPAVREFGDGAEARERFAVLASRLPDAPPGSFVLLADGCWLLDHRQNGVRQVRDAERPLRAE